MTWEASRRNFDGVQHEQIRKAIDGKFNDVHDRLSAAYYNGGTFTQGDKVVDFGKLKASDPASAKQIFLIHWYSMPLNGHGKYSESIL